MTLPIDRSPPLPRDDAVAAKPKPDHAAPSARMPFYAWLAPLLAVALVGASAMLGLQFTLTPLGLAADTVLLFVLFGTVFAAVYHAEILAHRLGEPYGTLTLAVTVIEVSLIATMMLGGKTVPTLARDTVFAVVMIVCNGLVGYCVLAGGLQFREQEFQLSGTTLYLSVTIVLATITLILPNYTFTDPGTVYSAAQLAFVSLSAVVLYVVFLYAQTSRHRAISSATPASLKPTCGRRTGCWVPAWCCCWCRCWRWCCWRRRFPTWSTPPPLGLAPRPPSPASWSRR
jgi:Ca2+:H+ antiporter